MTSARTIRKNHKTRTFISKRQIFEDGMVWPARRFGLAYGDTRSHQKRRHVTICQGSRALNRMPHQHDERYDKQMKTIYAAHQAHCKKGVLEQKKNSRIKKQVVKEMRELQGVMVASRSLSKSAMSNLVVKDA